MQQFQCTTQLFFGADALSALAQVKSKQALIVTDRFFWENGTAQRIAEKLTDCQCRFFTEVLPDPEVRLIAKASAEFMESEATVIVALGGGSVLDCAKAIAYFAKTRPMLIAIPTTSGTGSEVTSFSILTHDGVKHPLVDDSLRPDWAILDESLLSSLPPSLIADSGMDLISHAIEAVAATNASPFTDALAIGALNTALRLLPRSFGGDATQRGAIHAAATMAGMAFDRAGLGACHALSHALGGHFHVAHGRLNAVLLPAVMQQNLPAALVRYADAARACGIHYSNDQMAFRNLLQQLKQLRRTLNLPQTLAQAGIDAAQLMAHRTALAKAAMEDPCMKTNPIVPTVSQLEQLLEAVCQ